MDQSTCVTTSSTSTPLGPRPAFPPQTPAVKHLTHDLPHIPSAGPAPVPAYDDAWGRPSAWAAF